jgi:hypothetical protein
MLVVAMGAAEKARGPGGGLNAAGVEPSARAAAGRTSRHGNGSKGRRSIGSRSADQPSPEPGDPSRGFLGWVAPPERDWGKAAMEKSLWDAADQFRANSGLKAQEFPGPLLGLIFLRFADARFMPRWRELKAAGGRERRGSREEDPPTPTRARGCCTCPPAPATRSCSTSPAAMWAWRRVKISAMRISRSSSKSCGRSWRG